MPFPENLPQCTALSRRSGERCRNPAVHGLDVCRMHGGGSPHRGTRSGRPIRHGRYSRLLPDRLAARYQEAERDNALLNLRAEISLIDARLAELLGHLSTGESGQSWREALAAWRYLTDMAATGDVGLFRGAMDNLGRILQRGASDPRTWGEIVALVETRRRLVESERRRLVEMQQMISAEQAMALLASVTAIIRENIPDGPTRNRIASGIRGLLAVNPSQ